MDDRVLIICPGNYGNLKAEVTYPLEELFSELDRLNDENDSLKAQISDMEDDIAENYVRRKHYDTD